MGTVDVVIGRVVAVHIADDVLTNGMVDVKKTQPIARCGYYHMMIPSSGEFGEDILGGLEGNTKKNRALNERKGQLPDSADESTAE